MLKGLDPVLGPDMLATLRAMGHGDEIALVDGNYPGLEHARRLVRADGHDIARVLNAVLSVMPIDDLVDRAIFRACAAGDIARIDPVHREMIDICLKWEPDLAVVALPPEEFYARVRNAHTIVQTSEARLHGNIVLRKGVIQPSTAVA